MKRFLTLFLSLCLVLTLTACSGKKNNSADKGSNGTSSGDSESNSGSTDGVEDRNTAETRVRIGSGNNIFKGNDSTLRSQVYGAKNGSTTAKGNTAMNDANSSGFAAMLRNGRVRDTDGDLTDGENALHGSYGKRVAQ